MRTKLTGLFLLVTLFSFGQIVKNQEWKFEKKVTLDDSVRITTGATSGYVLTSDTRGIATWQASGSGVVQSATTTISSAQILALHTTPITLVAAQGASTAIVPISMTVEYLYSTAAYATDNTLIFTYGGGTWITIGSGIAGTSNVFYLRNAQVNAGVSGSNAYSNSAFSVTTPTSNPTAGSGTLKITVLYSVVNL